jgi:membrane protease YdiL (CAAX protease family)
MKVFFIFIFIFSNVLFAQEQSYSPAPEATTKASVWDFSLKRKNPEEKGVFWGPFFNLLLPGVNQWWEDQWPQAFLYSGLGVVGVTLMNTSGITQEEIDKIEEDGFSDSENDNFRQLQYGAQIYSAAASYSAYASFQSSVKYRKEKLGEYKFIHKQETVDEILLAPFEFSFLKRKTTWIPMAIIGGLVALSDGMSMGNFQGADAFYSAGYSYNAGTHEEAMFRGWLMPMFHQNFDSPFWANATTSVLFAAAHGFNPAPLPQLAMGYYLGWLTQKNKYSIKEAVFIHVWWDVVAIAATYMDNQDDNDEMLYVPLYFSTF